ncbi:hypothetical protein ACH4E7_40670 [Kitasatospora sp. NPDC018058]|uniref:hypothetical protein n=1 Tax=Kitasatospora sp. NPDC018058 TaxID=3364025 RepID=UPI0037C0FC55
MSSTDLPLHDLLEGTIDDVVATASPDAGRWLVAELERRGAEAMWEAARQLLSPLAERPAYGLPEHDAAARLRLTARSAQPDVALVLEMRLTHWEQGEEAVAALWQEAAPELRRIAIMHLLITYCMVHGCGGRRLDPKEVVSLIRQTIPPFSSAAR